MHDEIRGEIEKLGPLARVEPQHCTTLKKVVKHLVTTFIGPNAKEVTQKQWKLAKLAEWRNALPEAKRPARLMVFFDEVRGFAPPGLTLLHYRSNRATPPSYRTSSKCLGCTSTICICYS